MPTPEEVARQNIDALLQQCGWLVQDYKKLDLSADLRPAHQPAFHPERMEQLRHRLTPVSPKGQRRSVDQNTLKRTDLDDLESPAAPLPALRVACYFGATSAVSSGEGNDRALPSRSRHERKETDRFKGFTYEELIKRDKRSMP